MFKQFCFLLALSICASSFEIKVKSIEISDGNNTQAITNSDFFGLRHNSLREGFEHFFEMTNLFIDAAFKVPNETIIVINNIIKDSDFDLEKLAKTPQKVHPNLFYFTVAVLVLAFLIPIIGLIFCSYRCCCRGKISPYDRKRDSFRRKFYGFSLLIVLMAMLIATVILFFTNQNSSQAIRRVNVVFPGIKNDIIQFNDNEMPVLYESIKSNLKIEKSQTDDLINETANLYLDRYFNILDQSEVIKKLKLDIENMTTLAMTVPDPQFVEAFQSQLNVTESLQSFKGTLKNKINGIDIDLTQFDDSIAQTVDSLEETVDNILNQLNSTHTSTVTEYWNIFSKLYDYVYSSLMVVSIFVLFLFVIYGIGLSGICSRRTQPRTKQCCHRTVLARFLMSGIGFFVISSWIILIFSVTLYIPGITFRHFICKPGIEIEKNHVFNEFVNIKNAGNDVGDINLNILNNIKYTKIIRECDRFNKSVEIEHTINSILPDLISNNFDIMNDLSFGDKNDLATLINEIVKKLREIESKVAQIQNGGPLLEQLLLQILKLKASLEANLIDEKESNDYKSLISSLEKMKNSTKQDASDNIVKALNQNVAQIIKDMPSCQIVSKVYKSVVNVACYEFLDNYNTYWFVLIIVMLLNLLIVCLAVKQADLYRKNYSYGRVGDAYNEKNMKYMHKNKSKRGHRFPVDSVKYDEYENSNSAIDAFEMKDYHRFQNGYNKNRYYMDDDDYNNNNQREQRGSPPPRYYH